MFGEVLKSRVEVLADSAVLYKVKVICCALQLWTPSEKWEVETEDGGWKKSCNIFVIMFFV